MSKTTTLAEPSHFALFIREQPPLVCLDSDRFPLFLFLWAEWDNQYDYSLVYFLGLGQGNMMRFLSHVSIPTPSKSSSTPHWDVFESSYSRYISETCFVGIIFVPIYISPISKSELTTDTSIAPKIKLVKRFYENGWIRPENLLIL